MQSIIKIKYVLLFALLSTIFGSNLYSQKELKQAIETNLNQEQLERDSLLNLIQVTKNDTLRADLCFQYFELSAEIPERVKYSKLIINGVDSALNHTKASSTERKALLNRKAMALRHLYYAANDVDGAGSKKGIEQLMKAIVIYKETNNDVEIAQSYVNLADDYLRQGNLLDQLQTLQEGLSYESDRKFNRGISRFYVQLQLFYSNLGDTAQALSYVEKALDLEKLIADPTREARGYYLAGLTYSRMGKHQKAIDNLLRSLESYKKENMQHKDRIGQTYLLLGDQYLKVKEYDKALTVYEEILTISTKANDIRMMFLTTLEKGRTKSLKGENLEALKIHNGLLKLAKEAGFEDKVGKQIYTELSLDYYNAGNYPNARKNIERAIQLSDKDAVMDLYDMEELAYRIDSSSNFYEGAYKHYYQMHLLKEKLNKEEVGKSAAKDRFMTELNDFKKDQEKQDAIANEEKKKQRIILFSVIGGLLLLFAFSVFVLKNLRTTRKQKQIIELKRKETEEQKLIIEEKNKDITDSINYAQRIQQSMLPPLNEIYACLSSSFVLFRPKDIVSGDFYWYHNSGKEIFIAAADCTGHGVPGAIMSMLATEKLNEAIALSNDVADILSLVNKGTKKALRQSGNENSTRDGMDIAICSFNKKMTGLSYAGANRPLWIIRNEDTIIEEIKATKTSIGGTTEDGQAFEKHKIKLQKGDTVYIFSDGYADQFSPEDKKLMTRKFKEIMLSIQHLSMKEQRNFLDDFMTQWKGNMEQTDDILVIGVKV